VSLEFLSRLFFFDFSLFRLRRSCGPGLFRNLREGGSVLHRDIGQYFAVDQDAGNFHSVDELAVSQIILASSGTDALNPQAAILALFYAAIALGIAIRSIRSFLRRLIQLALGEEKAFGPFEIFLTLGSAFRTAFYAWHGFAPSIFLESETGCEEAQRRVSCNGFVSGVCGKAPAMKLAPKTRKRV
jgi:hypothetical protein